jgi:hypothetical protein
MVRVRLGQSVVSRYPPDRLVEVNLVHREQLTYVDHRVLAEPAAWRDEAFTTTYAASIVLDVMTAAIVVAIRLRVHRSRPERRARRLGWTTTARRAEIDPADASLG